MNAKRKMVLAALFMAVLSAPVFAQMPPGVRKELIMITENGDDQKDWYLGGIYVDTSNPLATLFTFKTKGIVTEEYRVSAMSYKSPIGATYHDVAIRYHYLGDARTWEESFSGTASYVTSARPGDTSKMLIITYNGPGGERLQKVFSYNE